MDTSSTSRQQNNHRPQSGRLTRKRIPLSCPACRVRKLKCNREKPCQNCLVRGDATAAACSYAEKADGKSSSKAGSRSDPEDMRKRIKQLEGSILNMLDDEVKSKVQVPSPASSNSHTSIETNPEFTGAQKLSVDTRSTHWDAILNDLEAMKYAMGDETDHDDHVELPNGIDAPSRARRPNLLNGLSEFPDRSTILLSIPPRDVCDRLIARFFADRNPLIAAPFLFHKPTFLKECEAHWNDPTRTSIIWIASLFGVLCLAMHSYRRSKLEAPDYPSTATAITESFRLRTAQCIGIANVTKPSDSMVQAYMLYSVIEYCDEDDNDTICHLLTGTVVRLALQQGFHRDPSQHPNLTVFQAEMRRRLWIAVCAHEGMFAVKVGLPKSIRFSECDTGPPGNYYEEELYEDMEVLPPSRPMTESTPVSFFIAGWPIIHAFGCIIEFLHLLTPQPHEEVLRLDAILRHAGDSLPPHLAIRKLEDMMTDSPFLIMERYVLQAFYHKGICLLHRKKWNDTPADTDHTFSYSRKMSVNSSIKLLDQQSSMHRGCQPSGPIEGMRWYQFSVAINDFLLAAMVLCLDLMAIQRTRKVGGEIHMCLVAEIEKFKAIQRSRAIWAEVIDDCKDAKRAVGVLDAVLRKLSVKEETNFPANPSLQPPTELPNIAAPGSIFDAESLKYSPYFVGEYSLGIPYVSGTSIDRLDTYMQDIPFAATELVDSFPRDIHLPDNFDWDAWDQFMSAQGDTLNSFQT